MPEQIRCPECSATLRVPDTLLGKKVKCPKCQTAFTAELDAPAEPDEGIVDEPSPPASRRRPTLPEDTEDEPPPEDEEEDRPRRRKRRRSTGEAASAVAGPAIALMVTGGLGIALTIINLIFNLLGVSLFAAAPQGGVGADQAYVAGRAIGMVIGVILGFCWGGILLAGGLKMKNLQSYGLAMTACIVGILPCSLCCLLGLPFGIWGLVVINRPEVKDAFS